MAKEKKVKLVDDPPPPPTTSPEEESPIPPVNPPIKPRGV